MTEATTLVSTSILWTALQGCLVVAPNERAAREDPDGDGVYWPDDCDDLNAATGARGSLTVYRDEDRDGFGVDLVDPQIDACPGEQGFEGYSDRGGDCNDDPLDPESVLVYPGAEERCNGVDDNCDGNRHDTEETCRPDELLILSGDSAMLVGAEDAMAGAALVALRDAEGSPVSLAVGAPSLSGASPACFLVPLPLEGERTLVDGDGLARVGTTQESSRLGASLLSLPDVDGDGVEDLVLGAPNWDLSEATDGGAVWILASQDDPAENILDGDSVPAVGASGEMASFTLGLTSLDDGRQALVVGAPGLSPDEPGGAFGGVILLDPDDLLAVGPEAEEFPTLDELSTHTFIAGTELQRAGGSLGFGQDLNGDGVEDVAVGARASDGRVWLLEGPLPSAPGLSNLDDAALVSWQSASGEFGYALAASPDVTGDGTADLALGAPGGASNGGQDEGFVFLIAGGTGIQGTADVDERALARFRGGEEGARLGQSVVTAGDLDGDANGDADEQGRLELALGAPGADANGDDAGAVFAVFGPVTSGTYDLSADDGVSQIGGETPGDAAGHAILGLPDPERDGYDMLLVGAPWARVGKGVVYQVGVGQ